LGILCVLCASFAPSAFKDFVFGFHLLHCAHE
jgi:hypothetical protein